MYIGDMTPAGVRLKGNLDLAVELLRNVSYILGANMLLRQLLCLSHVKL